MGAERTRATRGAAGARPMDCREFVEVVTAYVELALAEGERLRTELHLDGCAGCRAYLDQMERTIRTIRRLADER